MYGMCKCLNVTIKAKDNKFNKINIDDIELNSKEKADSFFNSSELVTTKELENITKEQPGLVEVRSVGPWTINRCCNCSIQTHAVHKELGAAMVLINSKIITSEEEIEQLKASPNYSPIFRVIIDRNKVDDLDSQLEQPTKFSVSQLPSTLRLALSGLEQQLQEAMQSQARLTDEKIRAYTKEQYNILEEFRERAHNEHSFLKRLIRTEQQNSDHAENKKKQSIVLGNAEQKNNAFADDDVVDTTLYSNSRNNSLHWDSPSKPVKSNHLVNGKNSINKENEALAEPVMHDLDTMFVLEGMDDHQGPLKQLQAPDAESDTDDSGNEMTHIRRVPKSSYPTIAKSLPVNVPTFHSFGQRFLHDETDEKVSLDPMDPHNIQASIKALAKSVHGDTVFGDLPRPRFSTQI